MSERRPAVFRIEPEEPPEALPPDMAPRPPRALQPDAVTVQVDAVDVFDLPEAASAPPPTRGAKRRSFLGSIFAAAFGILVSLAVGLWADALIRDLFAREPWLGWVGLGAAALAAATLLLILFREILALSRLASVEAMRRRGREATAQDDAKAARAVVAELTAFLAAKPETAAGRRSLALTENEIIDGAALVRLAETELLSPLDARAKTLILDASKRVSMVTAVSPRAFFDVAYVIFEGGRLVRRLAELYGGRPGTLGFFRLARSALAHLAVTGSIAAGDSVVQQLVGHGLAAKLSAKLGEGVINGMMTARIGVAAMEAARPLPFAALKRPGMGDFLSALASFAARERRVEDRG